MAFSYVSQVSGSSCGSRSSKISLLHPWLAVARDNDVRLLRVADDDDANSVHAASSSSSSSSSASISLPSPHARSIAALRFDRVVGTDSLYLITVSEDALVVWKNPQSFDEFAENEVNADDDAAPTTTTPPPAPATMSSYRCQKISSGPFLDASHVALHSRGNFVSLTAGNDAAIVCLVNGAEARLPHRRAVVQTAFPSPSSSSSLTSASSSSLTSSSSPVYLISISGDASLRCWDVRTTSCLRVCDSVFRLSSPLSCLRASFSYSASSSIFIDCFVGDADGNLFRLSFEADSTSSEDVKSHRIDLKSHLDKWRRRRLRQRKKKNGDKDGGGGVTAESEDAVVPGCDVLAIHALDDRLVFVAVSSALLLFDASINECISVLTFGESIPKSHDRRCRSGSDEVEDAVSFPIASTVSVSEPSSSSPPSTSTSFSSSSFVFAAVVATFSGQTNLVRLKLPAKNSHSSHSVQNGNHDSVQNNSSSSYSFSTNVIESKDDEETEELYFPDISVVATEALTEDSALKAPPLMPIVEDNAPKKPSRLKPSARNGSANSGGVVKKSPSLDQPVVVRDKVKSSGYSVPPRNPKMFQPNTDFSSVKKSPASAKATVSSKGKQEGRSKSRPTDAFPESAPLPSAVAREICLSESRATPVSALSVSSCGAHVACGVTDYNITIVGESLAEKSVTSHAGHKGVIHVANWSHDGVWLVTACSDKTAGVWRKSAADPVMFFEDQRNNFAVDKVTPRKDQKPFPAELRHAQFYYLDKFILLASANKIFLCVHHLDPSKNDLQRYKTGSRYKLVKEFEVEDVQAIVAASAVNSFYSHLALSACSNKSVDVLDLNVGRSLLRIEDAHEAKIHTVAQNQGSRHSALSSSEAYNLFLTAAVGPVEGVKLWDLRKPRFPVRLFNKHVNRVLPTCSAAFSPCGRFVASGSEDCHSYLYDVGSGSTVQKYRAKDGASVTHVAFHPLHMKMFMATLNGTLYLVS